MKSTEAIVVLCFELIFFSVSTTIVCWVCLGVRKNIVCPFVRACSSAGVRAATVFPIPVGAWATMWPPFSTVFFTSARKSFCPPRILVNGNKSMGFKNECVLRIKGMSESGRKIFYYLLDVYYSA